MLGLLLLHLLEHADVLVHVAAELSYLYQQHGHAPLDHLCLCLQRRLSQPVRLVLAKTPSAVDKVLHISACVHLGL
jgi:hypothetical protein